MSWIVDGVRLYMDIESFGNQYLSQDVKGLKIALLQSIGMEKMSLSSIGRENMIINYIRNRNVGQRRALLVIVDTFKSRSINCQDF